MKNSIRFFVGISLLVLVACFGCGEKYQADMQAAQEAMDKAKSLFAQDLASSDWNAAMQTWEQAQAAVKEGKPAITYFKRAKSRFEKAAKVAKATGDDMAKEIASMQQTINTRLAKVKTALDRGKLSPKVANQVKPMAVELEEGAATVDSLASQGNYLKANIMARELQTKVYNAELIIAGKKPK